MIVVLTADAAGITEPDDCTRLHVSTALAPAAVDPALRRTGIGRLSEDGSALLDVRVLHEQARTGATAEGWDDRWQAMIDYAGRKGWLTADGTAVQAHVEGADAGAVRPPTSRSTGSG